MEEKYFDGLDHLMDFLSRTDGTIYTKTDGKEFVVSNRELISYPLHRVAMWVVKNEIYYKGE
jgi:hypothetical protein